MTDFTFEDLDMKDLHEIHSVMKKDKKTCKNTWGQFLLWVNIASSLARDSIALDWDQHLQQKIEFKWNVFPPLTNM